MTSIVRIASAVAAAMLSPTVALAGDDASSRGAPPDEVVVQGDALRDPVAPKDTSVAGSVVPRDRLVGPGLEAQDVLRTQPGVIVAESGAYGAPATAAIRGATAADTPVYLAGIRLNDDVGGTADLSLVPLWLIDRIEVYRGHAPIEADDLGPGGAIFFEPRRPSKDTGGVGVYGGSWGESKGWAYQGVRAGPVTALAGVSADHATNRYPFVDDHGELFEPQRATVETRQNADETTVDGWGLARVDLGGGATADLLLNAITREQGVPSLALLPTRAARERTDRTLAAVRVHAPLSPRASIDATTSMLIGRNVIHDPLLELELGTRDLDVAARRIEQTVGAGIDVTDALRLRPIATLSHEAIDRTPDDIPLGRARREFARAALGAREQATDWLAFHALASGECHHTGVDPGELCDVLAPTGRVGAEASWGRLRVLANAGRYVRVPTLGEVYGISDVVHGNPALAPESGYTIDAGVRAQTPRGPVIEGAYVDAFAFAHWVSGLIAYERTGQGYVTPYNVGRARVAGAEVLGGIAFATILRAEVAATLLDPRDTTPGRLTVNDVLPFRSRFIAAPRLRADFRRRSKRGWSGAGGELRAVYQSSRYADPAGLGVIAPQTSVDVEAYVSFFGGLLTARARVADLLNATRTDIVGYPLPGRSFYAGLESSY